MSENSNSQEKLQYNDLSKEESAVIINKERKFEFAGKTAIQ